MKMACNIQDMLVFRIVLLNPDCKPLGTSKRVDDRSSSKDGTYDFHPWARYNKEGRAATNAAYGRTLWIVEYVRLVKSSKLAHSHRIF